MSFAHLKKKFVLKQWENLESHYLTMTRIAKDVLNATSFDVVNERLFSIANKIYDAHKFYHSATIRAKMIIRQHDFKENEWEMKNAQLNLKKEEELITSKIAEKIETRDQALRNEMKDYINDVDEITTSIIVNNIQTYEFCYSNSSQTNKSKKKVHSAKDFIVIEMKLKSRTDHRAK